MQYFSVTGNISFQKAASCVDIRRPFGKHGVHSADIYCEHSDPNNYKSGFPALYPFCEDIAAYHTVTDE